MLMLQKFSSFQVKSTELKFQAIKMLQQFLHFHMNFMYLLFL